MTLSIVGTSDLHGAALPSRRPRRPAAVRRIREQSARGARVRRRSGSADRLRRHVSGRRRVESQRRRPRRRRLQRDGLHRGGDRQPRFRFRIGRLAGGATVAGRLRGALKARAAQARYPFLAANLIDEATGRLVDWPNVRPSVLVEAAGIKVGIVGVMTIDALRSTIAANVQGLRMAPLARRSSPRPRSFERQAPKSSSSPRMPAGAASDSIGLRILSSCDAESEIFRVARSLPHGLVDVIAAGHTHGGLGHQVDGIGIIQPFSRGQSFGRVDIVFDRRTRTRRADSAFRTAARSRPAAVRKEESSRNDRSHRCGDGAGARARSPASGDDARCGPRHSDSSSRRPSGRRWETCLQKRSAPPCRARTWPRSTMRRAVCGRISPEGPLTFGRLYDVFPFDNRIARITLSGAELRRWLAGGIRKAAAAGLGFQGVDVRTSCRADGLHVDLFRGSGPIHDDDRLLAVTIGGPTLSGNLASSDPVAAARSGMRRSSGKWSRTGFGGLATRRAVISTAASRASASPFAPPACQEGRRLPAASR